MSRLQRRMHLSNVLEPSAVDPEQRIVESALRGRTARKIRAELRRGVPVVLHTPRWSQAHHFLEDVSLDLAVGEPGILCRTVSLRPAAGLPLPEVWPLVLRAFAQLGQRRWVAGPSAAIMESRGFKSLLSQILTDAEGSARQPVALLAHGADRLPVGVLEDIAEVWTKHESLFAGERQAGLLLAGAAGTTLVAPPTSTRMDLSDYGEDEAVAAMLQKGGPFPSRALRNLARFTGGIPSLVDAVSARMADGDTPPLDPDALLDSLGQLADELRGAVDIACTDEHLAERLHALRRGEALAEDPEIDRSLLDAGLLRRSRGPGGARVELRAPAIAALVA